MRYLVSPPTVGGVGGVGGVEGVGGVGGVEGKPFFLRSSAADAFLKNNTPPALQEDTHSDFNCEVRWYNSSSLFFLSTFFLSVYYVDMTCSFIQRTRTTQIKICYKRTSPMMLKQPESWRLVYNCVRCALVPKKEEA